MRILSNSQLYCYSCNMKFV